MALRLCTRAPKARARGDSPQQEEEPDEEQRAGTTEEQGRRHGAVTSKGEALTIEGRAGELNKNAGSGVCPLAEFMFMFRFMFMLRF